MPRAPTKVFKKRKRECNVNTKRFRPNEVEQIVDQPRPRPMTSTCSPNQSRPIPGESVPVRESTSKKKLQFSLAEYDSLCTDNDECNDIVNLNKFENLLMKIAVCVKCGGSLKIQTDSRLGLSCKITVVCSECTFQVSERNDSKIGKGKSELNTRLVYAFRCIGKGEDAAKNVCAIMNLANPPAFKYYTGLLCNATKEVCLETMRQAVQEVVEANDGNRDVCASFDGTWHRRGHRSLNGVVSAISVDTGKVLDVRVYTKHCRCNERLQRKHEANCIANYEGVSGGMEVEGVLDIFRTSVAQYGIRYTKYLGDGDSSAFPTVLKEQPYGPDCLPEKLECVGHVQKRMGARLKKLKTKMGREKLEDGKTVGGRGRLTDAAINKIQNLYGVAIRRNVNKDLNEMKQEVWAEYYHIVSSDASPSHELCPKGNESWCKYNKALAKNEPYVHADHFHLPTTIMEQIKPIFRDLAQPDLLKKCLHGGTQNPNESLNSVIWSRIPKSIFVMKKTLELGVFEAVACYNKVLIVRCQVLKKLGISPGNNLVKSMKKLDQIRIYKAEKAVDELEKKCRRKASLAKLKLEDLFQEEDDPDNPKYGAGMY